MKWILLLIVMVMASLSGFVVHVITAEWLPSWISAQVQGASMATSWDLKYLAAVMALEYGLAAMALYHLSREKLLQLGLFKAALTFSLLLGGIHAALLRQPVMDYAVGNPMHVVLVQNGFKWLVWLLMGLITVYGYEYVNKRSVNKPLKNDAKESAF